MTAMTEKKPMETNPKTSRTWASKIGSSMTVGTAYVSVGKQIPNAGKMKTITIINGRYREPFRTAL